MMIFDEKLSCYIRKDVNTYNFQTYVDYGRWEQISLSRTINENNYDEEYWKDKLTKVAYDLKAHVLYLKSIGLDDIKPSKMKFIAAIR